VKKTIKKLVLNRETLIELDRPNLQEAFGGVTLKACTFSGGIATCATCGGGCQTNLC
jgi:hypothetical protein